MIDIPIYNQAGEQTGTLPIDEQLLGGEIRPALLKQAYVRYHANRRLGTAETRGRAKVAHSTRKLYRQKGTGNARRGDMNANLLRGGGHAHPKHAKDWRQDMPVKQRRLANRNALLAKVVDGELKLVEGLELDTPSTKQMASLVAALGMNRPCLLALAQIHSPAGRSARNIADVSLTQIDRLNAFDILNHRYLVAERQAFEAYVDRLKAQAGSAAGQEVAA
ncbi:MAG: 50S ribosomal protein L4 [Phycisphaeraceae bacterium]